MFYRFCGGLIFVFLFLLLNSYPFTLAVSALPPLASWLFLRLPPRRSSTCLLRFGIFGYGTIFVHYVLLSSQLNPVQFYCSQNLQQPSKFPKCEEDYSCEGCPELLIRKEFGLVNVKATLHEDFFEPHSCYCREGKSGVWIF